MSKDPTRLIRTLARLYRIQTAYYGIGRKRTEASPESLLATLQALGAPVETFRDLPAAIRQKRLDLWNRPVEPVVVVWDGGPGELELRLPSNRKGNRLACRLELEDGTIRRWSRRLSSLTSVGKTAIEGTSYLAKRLTLPGKIPWGYHRLFIEASLVTVEVTLIAAPVEAYARPTTHRQWGLFAPLYAIHSRSSWGAGDYSDLERLVEWTAGMGGGVVSTLPFLAAFLDEPFDPSPYSPASRLFWNELYVDPSRAPEWETCAEARRHFDSTAFRRDLQSMRRASKVDYRRLFKRKREILEMMAESSYRRRPAEIECFARSHPSVLDYAGFRATMERRRAPWPQWPSRLRDGQVKSGDYRRSDFRYHVYSQWLARQQIATLAEKARQTGAGLYLDLPLGAHPFGYDTWSRQRIFSLDASVGAPPDPVFTGGQDWGFPPLHPERSREQGHRYFAQSIRHQLTHAGLLRIDHVMGLHRLFWIPKGVDFKDGVYVRYPAEELYAVLSLESHRHRSVIVGENLGIVPQQVNQAMARHNLQKMYLMQYALRSDPQRPMKPIPSGSVASLNTHDTPLFAAFWRGLDIADRQDLGFVDSHDARKENKARGRVRAILVEFLKKRGLTKTDTRSILEACWSHLRASRAGIVLVNLEDLWLETRPQNTPGSGKRRPNWKRKIRYPLDELTRRPSLLKMLKRVNDP